MTCNHHNHCYGQEFQAALNEAPPREAVRQSTMTNSMTNDHRNNQRVDRSSVDFDHAINLLEVVERDTRVFHVGNKFVAFAPWREERTPSLYIYPPGVGRYGDSGWSWKDYGGGGGPDNTSAGGIISYLKVSRGMSGKEAANHCYKLIGDDPYQGRPRSLERPAPEPPRRIDPAIQIEAAHLLRFHADKVLPSARQDLDHWLRHQRGLDPNVFHRLGEGFLVRDRNDGEELSATLAKDPKLDLLLHAGLMKDDDRGLRMYWRGPAAHLISTRDGEPMSFRARRLDFVKGDQVGKYLAQSSGNLSNTAQGGMSSEQVPFGEDILRRLEHGQARGPLLLMEGALDAVGASMLGLNAIGIGSRPGFGEHAVPITSPQGAWVQRNRSALLTASSVVIVPDADGGDKEATGVKMANNLANYMQANGVNAGVKTMAELGIDSQFKDFAKFAAKVKYDMDTP